MKALAVGLVILVAFSTAFAQQPDPNAPATKEDIERYMKVTHIRETMSQMMGAMSQPMHKMVHEQYLKDKDKLPAGFEDHMNRIMDSMFRDMPWEEMLDAEIPVYQKHLTKGDVESLIAFYSSPTGQKMMRDLPAIMSETMESIMPLIQEHMESIRTRIDQEFAQALQDSEKKAN